MRFVLDVWDTTRKPSLSIFLEFIFLCRELESNHVISGSGKCYEEKIRILRGIDSDGDGILNKVTESFSDKVIDIWAKNGIKWRREACRYFAGAGAFYVEGRVRTKAIRPQGTYYVYDTARNLSSVEWALTY